MRPARILLIRLRMAGDLILATPVFAALRRAFPDARIDLLVERRHLDLVDENPDLSGTVALDRGVRPLLRVLRALREASYDFCIDLHSIPKTAWIARLSGARRRIGFRYPDRAFLYTETVPPPSQFTEHAVVTLLRLVAPLGVFAHPGRAIMRSAGGAEEASRLAAGRIGAGARYALLHVAPSNRYKRWEASACAELSRGLLARGLVPALIGGAADRPFAEEILAAAGDGVVSLVGETSFKSLRELIRAAALYVGPDSGPAHIAATTPTPAVILYGPTTPATFGPFRPGIVHVGREVPCRPCRQKGCAPGDYRCMAIPAAEVLEKIDGLLRRGDVAR